MNKETTGKTCEMEWREVAPMPLCYFDMLVIVGQILLAFRHPENNGPSTHVARKLIKDMVRHLLERFPDQIPKELLDEWRKEG